MEDYLAATQTDLPYHYRAIWISDVHLGFKGCEAEFLNDFLKSTHCDVLYLVGDIIDLWSMKKNFFWHPSHYSVLRQIQTKIDLGTRVIYIPGNHDETFRDYVSNTIFGIEVKRQFIHRCSDGRRFLLVHGDEFDHATRYSRFVKIVGDKAYYFLLFLNRWSNIVRRYLGGNYWSLSSWLKNHVNKARTAIEAFESAAIHEAKRQGVDGIICGHIHHPEIKKVDNILYCNDGDWVENCTALVEDHQGRIELIHWADIKKSLKGVSVNSFGPHSIKFDTNTPLKSGRIAQNEPDTEQVE